MKNTKINTLLVTLFIDPVAYWALLECLSISILSARSFKYIVEYQFHQNHAHQSEPYFENGIEQQTGSKTDLSNLSEK